jgi:hypothetical protein
MGCRQNGALRKTTNSGANWTSQSSSLQTLFTQFSLPMLIPVILQEAAGQFTKPLMAEQTGYKNQRSYGYLELFALPVQEVPLLVI